METNSFSKSGILSKSDLFINSLIGSIMILLSAKFGGVPLIITFIPGVIFTWLFLIYIYHKQIVLPDFVAFAPFFLSLLAAQLLPFNEELQISFNYLFYPMYGEGAYSYSNFSGLNTISVLIFFISCILTFRYGIKWFMFPCIFFVIYGALGSGITHSFLSAAEDGYSSGLIISLISLILAPATLYKITPDKKWLVSFIGAFAVMLIVLIYFFRY